VSGTGGTRIVVIGVGAEFRCDDGAGLAVIDRLRGRLPADAELLCTDGEPTRLMEAWSGVAVAIVVDAVSGGDSPPGTLHRVVVADDADHGHAVPAPASSHGLGLSAAVELSRVLSRLPPVLILHGVQGAEFGYGQALSPAVAAVIDDLAAAVRADVLSLSAG
jgi:hydrogenase maturation protease